MDNLPLEDSEYETLFNELKLSNKKYDYGEQVVNGIEDEYIKGTSDSVRIEEVKINLLARQAELRANLHRTKNIKNTKMAHVNADLAKKRANIRQEMEQIKNQLLDLEDVKVNQGNMINK